MRTFEPSTYLFVMVVSEKWVSLKYHNQPIMIEFIVGK